MTTGVEFLWRAAGCPVPVETDGSPIPLAKVPSGSVCAATGLPASYHIKSAISDKFTTVKNNSRAWPFGGDWLSGAAVWACKSIALRCGLFYATQEHGVWFESLRPLPGLESVRFRIDALESILNPPNPPFVAGLPLYGIDHGGEANAERAVWWERVDGAPAKPIVPTGPWVRRDAATGTSRIVSDGLWKLQSKHTALYCRVSTSREKYHLQVDDASDVVVDVALWRAAKTASDRLLAELRYAGAGATDCRDGLTLGRVPTKMSAPGHRAWMRFFPQVERFVHAPWWSLFVGLLAMPEVTKDSSRAAISKPAKPKPAAGADRPAAPVIQSTPLVSKKPGMIQQELFG